jgi:hypothetical protein
LKNSKGLFWKNFNFKLLFSELSKKDNLEAQKAKRLVYQTFEA